MVGASSLITRLPKRKKAYEQVAHAIRQQIFSGSLAEGERLPSEREMAERFGVSRVVVREAIRTLELAGILRVQKGAGGGTFVSADYNKPLLLSVHNLLEGGTITLDHLFELRLMLEAPAAERAAARPSPEGLARLREVVELSRRVAEDPQALRRANLEFHRRLVAMVGNPLLSALCETVLGILVQSLEGKLSHDTSLAVLEHHQRIVAAVAAGRGAEARRLTEQDLGELFARYQSLGIEVQGSRVRARAGAGE
jgi:GntR family transcriptional repressor for pyruvate dehydrogenase complex